MPSFTVYVYIPSCSDTVNSGYCNVNITNYVWYGVENGTVFIYDLLIW